MSTEVLAISLPKRNPTASGGASSALAADAHTATDSVTAAAPLNADISRQHDSSHGFPALLRRGLAHLRSLVSRSRSVNTAGQSDAVHTDDIATSSCGKLELRAAQATINPPVAQKPAAVTADTSQAAEVIQIKPLVTLAELKKIILEKTEEVVQGAITALKNLSAHKPENLDQRVAQFDLSGFITEKKDKRIAEIKQSSEQAGPLVQLSESVREDLKVQADALTQIMELAERRAELGLIKADAADFQEISDLQIQHAYLSEKLSARNFGALICREGGFSDKDFIDFRIEVLADLGDLEGSVAALKKRYFESDKEKQQERFGQFGQLVEDLMKKHAEASQAYQQFVNQNQDGIPADLQAVLDIKVVNRLSNAEKRLKQLLEERQPELMTKEYLQELITAADAQYTEIRRSSARINWANKIIKERESEEFEAKIQKHIETASSLKSSVSELLEAAVNIPEAAKSQIFSVFMDEWVDLEAAVLRKHGHQSFEGLRPKTEFAVVEELHRNNNFPALVDRFTRLIDGIDALSQLPNGLPQGFEIEIERVQGGNFSDYSAKPFETRLVGDISVSDISVIQGPLKKAEECFRQASTAFTKQVNIHLTSDENPVIDLSLNLKV